MKYVVICIFFAGLQLSAWAETPLNKKSRGIVHIDHVPHNPTNKDPTAKSSHDGIIYPRKKVKK